MQGSGHLLATAADDRATSMDRTCQLAHAILDGTLNPTDRVAEQKPYYRGNKRHGINVQGIADATGRYVWAAPALPCLVHDLIVGRAHGISEALTSADMTTAPDRARRAARRRANPAQRRCGQGDRFTP
ncbi:hypothetical protein ACFQZ8_00280 [Micromonospora azadirachtae]|uniref:Uncharacterized protein n=1 Tax=Micromonospora azadirachtae TaxID=1970735 RepID=A0ABW2ZV76_9ACTN